MGDKLRQWLVLLALIGTIVMNGLANALPFNGQTTAMVSDKFQVLFVPAGYVFAIWGVTYLALSAYAIYQLLPAQAANPRLRRIGYPFVVSCVLNAVWLLGWRYEQIPLTVVLMLGILVTLIVIFLALDSGRTHVAASETWFVRVPFSIYLGWITVATVANVTDLLWLWRWGGFGIGPEPWAVIMLAVGFLLAAAMTLTRRDLAYPLVIVWAFAGIAVKQSAVPLVANAAWLPAGLTAAAILLGHVLLRNSPGRTAAG